MKSPLRNLLLITSIALLTGCLEIHDMGKYSSSLTVDASTEGEWETDLINPNSSDPLHPKVLKIFIGTSPDHPDAPAKMVILGGNKASNVTPKLSGQTIKIGNYNFLIGAMSAHRYSVDGDRLTIYEMKRPKIREHLKRHCPNNIRETEARGIIEINKLTDDAYQALASIPDTKEYWFPIDYNKLPSTLQ